MLTLKELRSSLTQIIRIPPPRHGTTLQSEYLEPLRHYVSGHGGRISDDGTPFVLMIDIKSGGARTYAALANLLDAYADILVRVSHGAVTPAPVRVVLSGNRPKEILASQSQRLAAFDGRLSDIPSNYPTHLMPIVSDRWTRIFRWKGRGPIPEAELGTLREIVSLVHAEGRQLRFWSTPERPQVWGTLLENGVDYISTDRIGALNDYLLAKRGHSIEVDQ